MPAQKPRPAPKPPKAAPAARKRASGAPPARAEAPPPAARRVRRPAPLPAGALKERRRRKRRIARFVTLSLIVLLVAGAWYACWLPQFRIQEAHATGPGAEAAQAIARTQTDGTYFYAIPRDSVFFLPKEHIRAAILDAVPEASAVSLTRTSFSSLELRMTPRASSFLWCGTSIGAPLPGGTCYKADIEGFIFAPEDPDAAVSAAVVIATTSAGQATSTQEEQEETVPASGAEAVADIPAEGPVHVFGSLDRDLNDGASPVRAHVVSPGRIPDALRFVDAVRELGAPVRALAIRDDEADLWVSGSTRITYILGHEKEAASLASSALPTLTLTDGSIQYVDLRFSGKAYVKRYGE